MVYNGMGMQLLHSKQMTCTTPIKLHQQVLVSFNNIVELYFIIGHWSFWSHLKLKTLCD